ncbi:hypothetical protein HDU84_007081 [Entophlyctis sp. JEL0112]|nr:hypothetical protein HDU84_007081 [Entophlyctis sp. JEL0112]
MELPGPPDVNGSVSPDDCIRLLHRRHTARSLALVIPALNTNKKDASGASPVEALANEPPAHAMLSALLQELSPRSPTPSEDSVQVPLVQKRSSTLKARQESFKVIKKQTEGVEVVDIEAPAADVPVPITSGAFVGEPDNTVEATTDANVNVTQNPKEQGVLGDYLFQKTIGEGQKVTTYFSSIWWHKYTNHVFQVAIKCMDKKAMENEVGTAERTVREILVLSRLHHQNITRLLEVVDTKDFIYLILEYEEGGELFDYIIAKNALPEDEARIMFRQLLGAIQYCHAHDIVHRDLKPENILLDSNGNVKLIDFGFANVIREGNLMDTFCGSPSYAAPEMITRKKYAGTGVDVWALGVILFVLVCGSHPFDHQHMGRMYSNILSGKFKFPENIQLTEDVKNLITSILNPNPSARARVSDLREHAWTNARDTLPRVEFYGTDGECTSTCAINTFRMNDESIIEEIGHLGFSKEEIQSACNSADPSPVMAAYYLLFAKRKREDAQMNGSNFTDAKPQDNPKRTNEISFTVDEQRKKPNNLGLSVQTQVEDIAADTDFVPRTPFASTLSPNQNQNCSLRAVVYDSENPNYVAKSPTSGTLMSASTASGPSPLSANSGRSSLFSKIRSTLGGPPVSSKSRNFPSKAIGRRFKISKVNLLEFTRDIEAKLKQSGVSWEMGEGGIYNCSCICVPETADVADLEFASLIRSLKFEDTGNSSEPISFKIKIQDTGQSEIILTLDDIDDENAGRIMDRMLLLEHIESNELPQ